MDIFEFRESVIQNFKGELFCDFLNEFVWM